MSSRHVYAAVAVALVLLACGKDSTSRNAPTGGAGGVSSRASLVAAGTAKDGTSYAIQARDHVLLWPGAMVTNGDVAVSDSGTGTSVVLAPHSSAVSRVVAPSILLLPGSVAGDLFVDKVTDRGGTHGAVSGRTPVPTIPPLTPPSTENAPVTISPGTSMPLCPGAFGNVSVGAGATLTLVGGVYDFAALRVGAGGQLKAAGATVVRSSSSTRGRVRAQCRAGTPRT
jgi:hypothetical protein